MIKIIFFGSLAILGALMFLVTMLFDIKQFLQKKEASEVRK